MGRKGGGGGSRSHWSRSSSSSYHYRRNYSKKSSDSDNLSPVWVILAVIFWVWALARCCRFLIPARRAEADDNNEDDSGSVDDSEVTVRTEQPPPRGLDRYDEAKAIDLRMPPKYEDVVQQAPP